MISDIADITNTAFELAADFIQYTQSNVFLTGKAGTGKTTFLKYIKANSLKQLAVVAPTGVAAINAGGVTIHSFFQLPFSPFIPETNSGIYFQENAVTNKNATPAIMDRHYLLGRIKLNNERRKIFNDLELLIIDEISMVRADVLDAIDLILRHFRNRNKEPFGGVQVLFIGDLFQLPPVAKQEEWQILSKYYDSPYFFSSKVVQNAPPVYIELEKIYRQKDSDFIEILNQIRNNQLTTYGHTLLHEHYQPNANINSSDGYIMLTTHNEKADAINSRQLQKINSPIHVFEALIEPDFPEKNYPAELALQLKEGAQVMFIKNDGDKAKRYFNGKIGIIEQIEDDKILVRCQNEPELIEVKKHRWEHIRYVHNSEKQQIEEEVVGTFTQYPLRLAWAITIHKSQGLTFEKAIIDAGSAFAPGQVYVALSRCTSLSSIILHTPINNQSLQTDVRIIQCIEQFIQPNAQQLLEAKKLFQQKTILHLFNLNTSITTIKSLQLLIEKNLKAFSENALLLVEDIQTKIEALESVAKKFEQQLFQLFLQPLLPEQNENLQNRIQKAVPFFSNEMNSILNSIKTIHISTDSKLLALEYNETLKHLYFELSQQQFLIQQCKHGFFINEVLQHKKNYAAPYFSVNAYATGNEQNIHNVPHPGLFKQLKALRDSLCEQKKLPVYLVASSNSLYEMTKFLPLTLQDLKKINGFGHVKCEQYGLLFLDIIQRYCNEHNLETQINQLNSSPKKQAKGQTKKESNTKLISLQLFQQGLNIATIAKERNLTEATIYKHLAHYVEEGLLPISNFLSEEKLSTILLSIQNQSENLSISTIKQKMPDNYSYSDIHMAMAHKRFKEKEKADTMS